MKRNDRISLKSQLAEAIGKVRRHLSRKVTFIWNVLIRKKSSWINTKKYIINAVQSNSVITNSSGPAKFVRYNREGFLLGMSTQGLIKNIYFN